MLGLVAGDVIDDERRWADAESIRLERPFPSERGRVGGRRRTIQRVVGGGVTVALVAGAVIARFALGHAYSSPQAAWRGVGEGLCALSALVLIIVLFFVQFRSRLWGRDAPTVALSSSQRKDLYAQVRGKRPADPRRLPLSRDLARRLTKQPRMIALFVALALEWGGQAIRNPDPFQLVALGVFVLLAIAVTAMTLREARRARRFLEMTPSTTDEIPVAETRMGRGVNDVDSRSGGRGCAVVRDRMVGYRLGGVSELYGLILTVA